MDYRRIALIAGLIAASLVCAGCVSETPAAAELTYYTEQYPPYNYEDNGTLKGIAVDLLFEMTGRMGLPVGVDEIRLVPWTEGYREALGGSEVVLFSTVRLPEREELFKWAGPIVTERKVLFARSESGISIGDPADLAGLTIGVVTDDAANGELIALGVDPGQLHADPDPSVMFGRLLDGKVDLVAYGRDAGEYIVRERTGGITATRVIYPLGAYDLYYAFGNRTPDGVVEEFQQALDALREEKGSDGVSTYERIAGRYESASALLALTYLTEEFPPLNYEEDGELKGVAVDLLVAIFENRGLGLSAGDIEEVVWTEGYSRALNESDTVLFSTARLPQREDLFKWAGPYISSDNVLIADTAQNITITDPADLDTLVIGVITDTSSIPVLESLGVDRERLVTRDSAGDLILMLENSSIDAWATGKLSGLYLIREHSARPSSFGPVYTLVENDYYYAFSRDTPGTTVAAFQAAIDEVKNIPDDTGVTEYQRILYRYIEPGCARQTVTTAGAMELVNLTAADIGKDATGTLALINAGKHPYRDADNPAKYVFVYNTDVTIVADAGNSAMAGLNVRGRTDVAGTPFRDQIVEGALRNGAGWVDYVYVSPVESGLFYKTAYYTLTEGSDRNSYIVCCGIYKPCV